MTTDTPTHPGQPQTKTCEWCGQPFQTTRPLQRFCKDSHRVRMAQTKAAAEKAASQSQA